MMACTTHPCPICNPGQLPPPFQHVYTTPPVPIIHLMGCICPPTSEQTCESPMCPRKNHLSVTMKPVR